MSPHLSFPNQNSGCAPNPSFIRKADMALAGSTNSVPTLLVLPTEPMARVFQASLKATM